MRPTDVDDLQEHLQKHFGLDDFRPSQREVISDVLKGEAVMCVMPTGAGKSLCYQLPSVVLAERNGGGITLVVSPLISLMEDQVSQLRDEGIPADLLSSSQGGPRQREVLAMLAQGWSGLLYVAPERFANAGFQNLLPQLQINLLAIDEAHCISQWGHDFRPDYSHLGSIRKRIGSPTTIALTATATEDVRGDIIRQLGVDDARVYVTGFDRPNLRYASERIEFGDRTARTIELIKQQPGSAIVYCSTRKNVDELTLNLRQGLPGRRVVPYHAGMDSEDRTASQEKFMGADDVVAVCTNAFGMGVNKPDTRLVVHYNIPGTLEAYYQEAGRAGRDGQPADCVLLYAFADRKTQEFFINKLGTDNEFADPEVIQERQKHARDKLDLMVTYAQTHRCRRQGIVDYFGDPQQIDSATCFCDVCRKGRVDPAGMPTVALLPDATVTLVRKLLSGIARVERRFGVTAASELLAGQTSERLERAGLTTVTTFGILRDHPTKAIIAMLHRLLEVGLARQIIPAGSVERRITVLELTQVGTAVMKGQRPPPASLVDIVPRQKRSGSRSGGMSRPSALMTSEETQLEMDPEAEERFQKLRAARAELAREHGLPPYVISHDRALRLIAVHQPSTLEALAGIHGYGATRAQKYGDAILRVLKGG